MQANLKGNYSVGSLWCMVIWLSQYARALYTLPELNQILHSRSSKKKFEKSHSCLNFVKLFNDRAGTFLVVKSECLVKSNWGFSNPLNSRLKLIEADFGCISAPGVTTWVTIPFNWAWKRVECRNSFIRSIHGIVNILYINTADIMVGSVFRKAVISFISSPFICNTRNL